KLVMMLGIGVVGVLSFIVSKLIFTVTPAIVANFFTDLVPTKTGQVLLEGLFILILLLGYIYIISLTALIKLVFQTYDAQPKAINSYESTLPLTVETVQRQSISHYR